MSRIGKLPIPVPGGVVVVQEDDVLTIKGPKGSLSRKMLPAIAVTLEDQKILCVRESDSKQHRSLHGLMRSLINNMVIGVTQGYEKRLNVIGVGYRAEVQGNNLALQVGYSHPVVVEPLDGITFEVGQDTNTRMPFVIVRGIDKEALGQQAAEIRGIRPPSPYKKPVDKFSKGIRYAGEHVRMKAGKSGKAAGK